MELITIARSFFALILVIFLIVLSIGLYNKFLQSHRYFPRLLGRKKHLKITEIIIIDPNNKIIEIARQDKRHLVLIGKNSEILLESYKAVEEQH